MVKFNNREEVIAALVAEFNKKPESFNYNKTAQKFWTFNRLIHYYWDIKLGRKETYHTAYNPATGYHELKSLTIC
jgi:hypothetical protein